MATQTAIPVTFAQAPQQQINHKNVIKLFAIFELLLGIVSIILGIVVVIILNSYSYLVYYYYASSIGEGVWCGIPILIAGILGIGAGSERSTVRMVNLHMGFSIVAAVAAGVLVCVGAVRADALTTTTSSLFGVWVAEAAVGFTSLFLLILSSVYCCRSTPYNCCGRCCADQQTPVSAGQQTTQVMTQQPVVSLHNSKALPMQVVTDGTSTPAAIATAPAGYYLQQPVQQPVPQAVYPASKPVFASSGYVAPPTTKSEPLN
ncbi:uncharacterized protein LOC143463546 [Clavelina lepadiformis]|uniref:uncharacterized protein LOC143463546 n=1 Tax=Clavelina lepadiformis TaxID=159417 RepID=UPI004041F920